MDWTHNWLLMALLVPLSLAVVCLIDSCLVGNKIYRHPMDGVLVSCLLYLVPVGFILAWNFNEVSTLSETNEISFSAVMAGAFYVIHLLFYFRTLFQLNDASGAETFLSLSVLIVPFLAWILLGELLPTQFYFAFLLAAYGVTLQSLPVFRKMGLGLFINMTISVSAISLSMVLQARSLQDYSFSESILTFNLTCLSIAVVIMVINRQASRRIISLARRFPALLIMSELLAVGALLSSHRAVQQGPSVSVVVLIECLLPLVILALSFSLIGINRLTHIFSVNTYEVLVLQVNEMSAKLVALVLLMVSLSILSLG